MNAIFLHNKRFRLYIDHILIEKEVTRIADAINKDLFGKSPIFICLLNGAFIFAADLLRKINFNCDVKFIKISSYKRNKSTGKVTMTFGLDATIENKDVIIIEDIIDSGTTLNYILEYLRGFKPASVRIAAIFNKPDAILFPVNIDYCGINIENKFVVGYGLDFDGLGRNYRDLYIEI